MVSLHQRLIAKKPRLCISIGDCCNNVISEMRQIFPGPIRIKGLDTRQDVAMLRKLFIECRGSVLIATAKRGERAITTAARGSYYTYSWLNALRDAEAYNSDITWPTLLKDTEERLRSLSGSLPLSVQHHSHWRIDVEPIDPPVPPMPNTPDLPAKPVVSFDEMNKFLNQLADESLSFTDRNALRQRFAPLYFGPTSDVNIYIKSPEKPVDIQPIDRFLTRMIINARNIVRINTVERLSVVNPDGRYKVLTVEEVR